MVPNHPLLLIPVTAKANSARTARALVTAMDAHFADASLVVTTWTGHELRVAKMAEAYAAAAIPQSHAIILPNPPVHGRPIYLFDRRVLEPSAAPPPRESPPQPLPQAQQARPPPPRPPDCALLAALLDAQHVVLQQILTP
jgi:hypothetical protein